MCGISGIISLDKNPVANEQLIKMTDALNRRGPDGEGYLIANQPGFCDFLSSSRRAKIIPVEHRQHISLGHRRLTITDLSDLAAQPMADSTGRYWIVFNGQVYNHVELRKELEAAGYKFLTDHSDTEVILNSYSHWGIDCLNKFNGMWAFALWDSVDNKMLLARDRAGKQPLFYAVHNNTFYFASELNSLLTLHEIKPELNDFAIYNYLTYSNVPAPETMFKNIYKVQGAHYLFFTPGETIEQKRFWNAADKTQINTLSEKQIVETIRDLMYESVRVRMQADVSIGTLLSGGIDSSINLACMSKYSSAPVKAYSVGFENKNNYRNEIPYARKMATLFKAELSELLVTEKDFFDFLPVISKSLDEPIADTANIPLYLISQLAHNDGVKVLLSGEGSDEIFVGYEHWRLIYEFEKIFRNRPLLASSFEFIHQNSFFKHKRPHYRDYSYKVKNNWPVFWSGTELRTERYKRNILSEGFIERVGNYNSFMPKESLYNTVTSSGPYDTFQWMTINDLQNRLPDQLLARLDRMMMANSVEGRNPFLDVSLVEFMLSVPSHLKTKQKTEKYLLKKAFEGILPDEILYRPKDSFTVPLAELFRDAKRKNEYMDLIRSFNRATGVFSDAYINDLQLPGMLNEFWNVLSLALWHSNHNKI